MQQRLRCMMAVVLVILALTGLSSAAESVRIVQNLDNISAQLNVSNQGSRGATLSLGIPAISLTSKTLNSTEYKEVTLPAAEHLFPAALAEEGKPDIPILSTMLAIPDQAGIELSVTYSGYDTFDNIDLAPVQPSASDTEPDAVIPFTIDQNAYSADAFYPEELASANDPIIMRDIRAAQIELHPVQYNPVRHELRVYRDLEVEVTYGGQAINPKTNFSPYISEGFYPIYKSMFANFEELFSTTEVKRGGYMIICKAALADSAKALALWKHKKGYTVRIVPTTEITPSGNPSSAQIFAFIQSAYRTWAVPPEYVMIVGDIDGTYAVPCYPYSGFSSDHKYACVNGTDFIPDIFVARLSVDNIQDFKRAVSKIFKYEEKPLMTDPEHWIRGLGVAYTYYESSRYITLWVRQLMLQNGFSRVDTVCTQGTDGRMSGFFNSGPGFIFYRGAGSSDGWWGPAWTVGNLNAMPNNQKLGVLSPLTCGTGDFGDTYTDPCFGETWIRMGLNPDSLKGGPAFFGVSDHNTHTQWNNPIMVGYFFGIFGENAYHFAAAAVRGKMNEYRTFPRHINTEVQQYFNTYNMLGDPELELRTKIPILLSVTNPETLAFGLNNIDVSVLDIAGHPVKDAFVTLIKMADSTEELYSLAKTDNAGNVSLSYNALTPGGMMLTVSGQNLYPYEDTVQIVGRNVAVGFNSVAIDDDALGFSIGNGDSLANPGETLELHATLRNFGDSVAANGVTASLTPLDEGIVEILAGNRNYGSIAPGEIKTADQPFVIQVSPKAADGEIIRLKEIVTDQDSNTWLSTMEIPVKAPNLVISHIAVQDTNNRLDPGDTVNLVITMINRGQANAPGVTGSLTTDDDFTTIRSAVGDFGDMPVGDTSSNTLNPMRVSVDAAAFSGRQISFTLHTLTTSGARADIPFIVKVDSLLHTNDPTGPDYYGHYMYDKNDTLYAPHPHYNWVEIVPSLGGSGTRLNYPGGDYDDNSVLTTLPFDFVYYGKPYRSLIVCINGFVSPDTTRFDMGGHYYNYFFNWPIPTPGFARAQISPFWDDLSFTGTTYGVYTYSDTLSHKYIIEWYHLTNNNGSGVETFEMIISDPAYYPTATGDADILFQYSSISNIDVNYNYSSVGIETWDELNGLQYTFDNTNSPGASPLAATMAVLITTNTGRGGLKGQVDLNNGGHNDGVKVTASSGQYRLTSEAGDYWIKNLPPGVINLRAEMNGYFPLMLDSITVVSDSLLSGINFDLTACPIPTGIQASDSLVGTILVNWTAITDPTLVGYNLYRSRWQNAGFTKVNSTPLTVTNFSDAISDTGDYWYKATAVFAGSDWTTESFTSNGDSGHIRRIVGITGEQPTVPKEFFLAQNYPNPFNPTTSISYGLPHDAHVKLEIFNIMGQKTLTLVDEDQQAGIKRIQWNGHDKSGQPVASGVYFYRIKAGDTEIVRKMSLIK